MSFSCLLGYGILEFIDRYWMSFFRKKTYGYIPLDICHLISVICYQTVIKHRTY